MSINELLERKRKLLDGKGWECDALFRLWHSALFVDDSVLELMKTMRPPIRHALRLIKAGLNTWAYRAELVWREYGYWQEIEGQLMMSEDHRQVTPLPFRFLQPNLSPFWHGSAVYGESPFDGDTIEQLTLFVLAQAGIEVDMGGVELDLFLDL